MLAWVAIAPVLVQAQAGASTPVRIGVVGPFTGPSADFGVPMLNGIKLAVDEINAVGGYLGRPLELVVKDDTANPDEGRKVSQDLLKEKVVAAIGFCNTGVAMKAIDLFQDAKTPLIVPCASGTAVTAKYPAPDSYIFRVQARDALQAPFMVDDILKRGWDKVAIFADTTGYGEGGYNDVVAALAAKNLKPVHVARFALGVKDLTAELTAARNAGATVVYSYTVGPENAVIANGKKALGWKVPQVGAWPLSFPNFIDGAKDAAEGALMVQTFIAEPSNERRASFLSSYTRKYQRKVAVPMAAANAYDATYLLMYSLLGIRDGNLSGKAIKESLEGKMKTYYGVVSTYEKPFSVEDKDAITRNMLVIGAVKNGGITFAYPEDAKRNLIIQRKQ
ncbi:MAG: ABC transporter substrate-binding protein [Gammaproteobacteria bacterium]|nr:ABC transporter substrate-binding protein [Gammaproteobacteria bacterium]MBU1506690.1 ABC transporter substrate-binding protein [Gammaproteobacteria bacterium]MBU2121656.1 ABC transporter substrate-binding protein [Gammaproteobacteria bacterium]MBU2173288.1 ABC transporter substrate-binding protein [Gammaproteobacteria bacterium]MBU2275310.1 ABC transporter substrate-binding protein [Gammaproteobacteria bacterium]